MEFENNNASIIDRSQNEHNQNDSNMPLLTVPLLIYIYSKYIF